MLYSILFIHDGQTDSTLKSIFATIDLEHLKNVHPNEYTKYLLPIKPELESKRAELIKDGDII